MPRTVLESAPSMGRLFARAALTARGRGGDLPDTRLARNGVAVDPAELAAYDRVCGFPLTDVLPATYPHVLTFPLQLALMSDRSFPLALPGLVHVRNRIEVVRPDRRRRAARPGGLGGAVRGAPQRGDRRPVRDGVGRRHGGVALAVDVPGPRGDGA